MTAPRIAPGTRREVGSLTWGFAQLAGRVTGTNPPNLFLTLGRHGRLFWGWLLFAGRLMPGGRLPRRDTELVILRVAHRRRCAYEAEHHRRLGRRAGLTPEELDRVADGPEADGWSERERAILRAVDQLDASGELDDGTWAGVRAHLSERDAIELLMLTGHYLMLASFLNTLRVEPDRHR